ncbi:MAG: hypothetical protein EBT70_16280 [Betaproteobacteria bacterium]|nr:hypothetical protein [Betaproteobacteria bacterium]
MTKNLKVVFAPGCFDDFEGTQEELDELVAEIKSMAERGELEENSKQLSEEEELEILRMLSERGRRQ